MLFYDDLNESIHSICENHEENYIDLIGLNASSEKIKKKIYYFENHKSYLKNLNYQLKKYKDDLSLIVSSYNSEVVDSFSDIKCLEMRLDVRDLDQQSNILNHMLEINQMPLETVNEILYLSNLGYRRNKIPSLYYIGIVEEKKRIICTKFFFRTQTIDFSDDYDNEYYLRYLEDSKYSTLNYLELCSISEEIIKRNLGNFHCIGLDTFSDGNKKYKFYFKTNIFCLDILIEIIKKFSKEDSEKLIGNLRSNNEYMKKFKDLKLTFFSICIELNFRLSVNLYYSFLDKKKEKFYGVRENLVSRDIGGLYFIVDIADKHCYTEKALYSVNKIGKVIFDTMSKYGVFTVEKILSDLRKEIIDYDLSMDDMVRDDIRNFINNLVSIGYVKEY